MPVDAAPNLAILKDCASSAGMIEFKGNFEISISITTILVAFSVFFEAIKSPFLRIMATQFA